MDKLILEHIVAMEVDGAAGPPRCQRETAPRTPFDQLSYGLVRIKREYCHKCSLIVVLCSFL